MRKFVDGLMGVVIRVSGVFVLAIVGFILFYLTAEARYAFNQKFPYGYRFAATGSTLPPDYLLDTDPNAAMIGAVPDALDGLDEMETLPMPRLEEVKGFSTTIVGAIHGTEFKSPLPENLQLADYREPRPAEQGATFRIAVVATPEHQGDKLILRWGPDSGFIPEYNPYHMVLTLEQAPPGVTLDPIRINLSERPTGTLELPAYVAQSDEDRLSGYRFKIEALPIQSTFGATINGMLKTGWDPTSRYTRYGVVPMLTATLLISFVAILIAAPLSLWLAIYIAEYAPLRTKAWLKATVELLASIPTVVLAYFGLMIVGPFLFAHVGPTVSMGSSRSLLTCGVMMGLLLIPTITTVAEDAISNLPGSLRDGAYALGMTATETIRKVLLPAARTGLFGALLLGLARAFGETMLVWLLSGGTAQLPGFRSISDTFANLGRSFKGVPDGIAVDVGNVEFEGVHYGHLFMLGLLLFLISMAINLTGYRLARKNAWTQ